MGMEWLSMMYGGSGRHWIEAALLIGLFWAVLVHPHRIRSLFEFRLAVVLLALSVIAPTLIQLIAIVYGDQNQQGVPFAGGRGRPNDAGLFVYLSVVPPALTMLAVLLGLDSVIPRRRVATPVEE